MSAPDAPYRLGTQAADVLEILGEGESYGLRIAADSGGRIALRAVYVILSRMVTAGLIEVTRIEKVGSAPRTVYRATSKGRRALAAHHAAAAAWRSVADP